ncbi:MAG: enoyl-CoA hydratase-related protein [Sphingorhabdus sp.]
MSDTILIDTPLDGVRRLTLNRPETLNAFTFEMYVSLLDALAEIRNDPSIRVVILTGAGRGFCSGHDLKNAGTSPWAAEGVGKLYHNRATILGLGAIPIAMRSLPQPVISAVNGVAAGIGYTLTLAADMAIAGRSAKFVNTIHNAATGAELGMSYLLPRAVGSQRAAELLLTARPVLAEEAERIGLVLRMVDDDMLIEAALDVARGIMVNVPMGIALTKQSLWLNQTAGSLEMAIELENRAVAIAQATDDAKEKRAAFFEKRNPDFTME